MDKVLNYLGLAQKAGLIAVGEESSGAVVRAGKAKALFLAADASDNARGRAQGFVQGGRTLLLTLPHTKQQISQETGKAGCSMLAVTDIGMASAMVSLLAQDNPGQFGIAAEELETRSAKAEQRKRETRAHVRNKKKGKRRNKA